MKITDTDRIDHLASNTWRLSYDEVSHRGFKWAVHDLERTSKPSKNIRTAIDNAICASKPKKARGE